MSMQDTKRTLFGSRNLLALAAATMLVVSMAPGAMASFEDYGTLVGESVSEDDTTGLLLINPSTSIMFFDADNSGGFDCGSSSDCDPIYLNVGSGTTVSAGDIRLFHSSLQEGEPVETTDDDTGNGLSSFSANFAYIDVFPHKDCPKNNPPCDSQYNKGEPVFIDTDGNNQLNSYDTQIIQEASDQNSTGSSNYQRVGSLDRVGNTTRSLPGQVVGYDANGDGSYNLGDPIFLDVNGDNLGTPGDIQLNTALGTSSDTEVKEVGDDLTVSKFGSLSNARFAWNDADSDGNVDDNEEIYIDHDSTDGSNVARFDIQIGPVSGSSSTSSNAGEQIDVDDDEISGGSTVSLTGISNSQLKFVDNNGNGQFDVEDDLFIDIDGSNNQVAAGDLLLSQGEGSSLSVSEGDRVSSGDDAVGDPLASPSFPGFSFVDFNHGGYGINDAIYLDWDSSNMVTPGDLRVSKGASPMDQFGEVITQGGQDANLCFRFQFSSHDAGWLESSGDSTTNLDEAVYLDRDGDGTISPLDVRLSGGGSDAAGTFVQTGDNDQGRTLTSFGATPAVPLVFYDTNGDSSFDLAQTSNDDSDAVYLDISAASGSTNLVVGDVHISDSTVSSAGAGEKVRSGNNDVNLPVNQVPSGFTVRGIDADGDANFDLDDEIYVNIDEGSESSSFRCPSAGDIRLSGSGGASGTGSSSGGGGGGGGGTTGGTTETPPSISIGNPSAGELLQPNTQVSISGTASGGSDSISSVSVTANGQSLTVTGTSSWSTSWTTPSSPGDYTITATVTDSENEQRSNSVTVTVGQDSDGDGVADHKDNCTNTPNADQKDVNNNGTGDACEDPDGDGITTPNDNCPTLANKNQSDIDDDGTGDLCDDDRDGDGVSNAQDAFPHDPQESQDSDGDGVGDNGDNCPSTPNRAQTDTDGDGTGDACSDDIDGDGLNNTAEESLGTDPKNSDSDDDGIEDGEDNCPATANEDQADENDDGIGDACADRAGGGQDTPAPGAIFAILAVGIAVLLRRRR